MNFKTLSSYSPLLTKLYNLYQENACDNTFRALREYYHKLSLECPSSSSQEMHIKRAIEKIRTRRYSVPRKLIQDLHIVSYIPSNWSHQNHIYNSTRCAGFATRFDYLEQGFSFEQLIKRFYSGDFSYRQSLGNSFVEFFRCANSRQPVDLLLAYSLPWDICPNSILQIHEEFGIPIVNISFDDKNWWNGIHRARPNSSLKSFSSIFDLTWTSSRQVLPWHWFEDSQAIYLPEAANSNHFHPIEDSSFLFDISFVGSNFGYRSETVSRLSRAGLSVTCFGAGWTNSSISDSDMLHIFNSSRINLGMSEFGYSKTFMNIKGRDFEVPSVGKGIYITSYSSDLAELYSIGREIICYRNIDELIDICRFFLHNSSIASCIAACGRARVQKDHQWTHRLFSLLTALQILLS